MIKERLKRLGRWQNTLMIAVRERFGETLGPSEFSRICTGVQDDRKARRVREECEIILTEWERKEGIA